MKSVKILVIFGITLSVICLLQTATYAQTAILKDPVMEFSSKVVISLKGLEATIMRIMEPEYYSDNGIESKEKCLDTLRNLCLFDWDKMSLECNFTEDQVKSTMEFYYLDSIKENSNMKAFLESGQAGSTVRTMIPEDETMVWVTMMHPDTFIPLVKETLTEKKISGLSMNNKFDIFDKAEKNFGREMHFILYDIKMGLASSYPDISAALIVSMKSNIRENELVEFSQMLDEIFVDKLGGDKSVEIWHTFDKVSYENFGCPAPVKPSYIIDRNFLIFATNIDSLNRAAEMVLTPNRQAASAKPPVMNGMATINMNQIMKRIPVEFIHVDSYEYDEDPHKGKIRAITNDHDWGIIRFERHHQKGKVVVNCEMNREIYSLKYHMFREGTILLMKDILIYKFLF